MIVDVVLFLRVDVLVTVIAVIVVVVAVVIDV